MTHPIDPPAQDDALLDALRPHRQATAPGDDPRARRQLEVTQLWNGELLSVRHLERSGRPVTVGDRPLRRRPILSTLLVATLVIGVAGFMIRHATLAPPPMLTPEDEALIEAWTSAPPAGPATPVADEESEAPEPAEPIADPVATWSAAAHAAVEAELRDAQEAIDRGHAEPRILSMPSLTLTSWPGWERLLVDDLLPVAEGRVADGTLPEGWRRALGKLPMQLPIPEQSAPQPASSFALGDAVTLADDARAWLVTPGIDRDRVTLGASDGERRSVATDALLAPHVPSASEQEAHAAGALAVASLLYRDALDRRSSRDLCAGADRLLTLPSQAERADLHARAGWCALNRGEQEQAREHLARVEAPVPVTVDADARTVFLRADARLARLDADAAATSGDADRRELARADARAALLRLRTHVVDELRSVSELRAVASELHDLELDALDQRREQLAQRAGGLGLLVLLLLPVAFVLDERRSTAQGCDFFVDADALPSDPFPLLERSGFTPVLHLPPGADARIVDEAGERPAEGDVPIEADQRVVATVGGATFVVQEVQRPRALRNAGPRADWGYLGVLAALLMISAAFTVALSASQRGATTAVQGIDPGFVTIALDKPEPPTPFVASPAREEDAGEGQRAPGEEGQVGRRDATAPKARGHRIARSREQVNSQMVGSTQLYAALDQFSDDGLFGSGDLGETLDGAVGGLNGPQSGDQRGTGGSIRGRGDGGGCLTEDCGPYSISGLGTRPGGRGRIGPGEGTGLGDRVSRTPQVGTREPITVGAIDKSLIDRVVKQHLSRIKFCYERELPRNPKLAGKLNVKFTIGKDGKVSSASFATNTLNNATVESCVQERFLRMSFPEPKGGGFVLVRYPLVFNSL